MRSFVLIRSACTPFPSYFVFSYTEFSLCLKPTLLNQNYRYLKIFKNMKEMYYYFKDQSVWNIWHNRKGNMLEVHPFTLYITLTQHENIVVTTTSYIHLNDHRSSGNTTTYTGTILTHNIQNQLISELKYLHDRICEIRGSPPLTATQSLCLSSSQTEICTHNIN